MRSRFDLGFQVRFEVSGSILGLRFNFRFQVQLEVSSSISGLGFDFEVSGLIWRYRVRI